MIELPASRKRALAVVPLAMATVVAFLPVVGNGFLEYDDDEYVTLNPHVRSGLTAQGIRWAFTSFRGGTWQPLPWLAYTLVWQLFGLQPAGFHLTNLLLHLACVIALFFSLDRMTGATGRSAFVAALFAVHPLHVQPVAWIASLKDVLSTYLGRTAGRGGGPLPGGARGEDAAAALTTRMPVYSTSPAAFAATTL